MAASNVKAELKHTPRFPIEDLAKMAGGPRVSITLGIKFVKAPVFSLLTFNRVKLISTCLS